MHSQTKAPTSASRYVSNFSSERCARHYADYRSVTRCIADVSTVFGRLNGTSSLEALPLILKGAFGSLSAFC